MMNRVRRTGRKTLLTSLVAAGALCIAGSGAYAASISIGTANGAAGTTASFDVTLQTQGAAVLGTQNDISFDPSTPIDASVAGNCAITTTTVCTTDAQCPQLMAPFTGNEPCVNLAPSPKCSVNASLGKGGFFAFTPSNCSGNSCTGVRALIFALNNVTTAIPDNSVLYSCTVKIADGTADGNFPLTVPAGSVEIADTDFQLIPNPSASNGQVVVGPVTGQFTVCDVSPSTGDNPNQFGDAAIDIFDVRALFAAEALDINTPPDGTARFSAMDASTVDTPPTCGGDGTLDIFDLRQCFAVSAGLADTFKRTGTGTSCTSVVAPQ
jgi:hypothetical protein